MSSATSSRSTSKGRKGRGGAPGTATKFIVDDFGHRRRYRRCFVCQRWLLLAIGNFSPRQRDKATRRVVRWDSRCLACRAATNREAWHQRSAEDRHEVNCRRWQRVKADPDRLERRRESNRELMRRARQDPEKAEKSRASRRNWYWRMKADPEKYAAYLESHRIAQRLRAERNGTALESMRKTSQVIRPRPVGLPDLPAPPLVEAVQDALAGVEPGSREAHLRACGIEPRAYFAWRTGERRSVSAINADAVVTGLDLDWWTVWPPESYPQAVRVFGEAA